MTFYRPKQQRCCTNHNSSENVQTRGLMSPTTVLNALYIFVHFPANLWKTNKYTTGALFLQNAFFTNLAVASIHRHISRNRLRVVGFCSWNPPRAELIKIMQIRERNEEGMGRDRKKPTTEVSLLFKFPFLRNGKYRLDNYLSIC